MTMSDQLLFQPSAAAIARVSSLAAAIAVEHIGTHHVSREELEARLASGRGSKPGNTPF